MGKRSGRETATDEAAYRIYFATNEAMLFHAVKYDRCYLLDDHSPDTRTEDLSYRRKKFSRNRERTLFCNTK